MAQHNFAQGETTGGVETPISHSVMAVTAKKHNTCSIKNIVICVRENNNTTTTILQPFVRDYPTRVSQCQKKHSSTHHPDHHRVFISFFHLP